MATFCPTTGRVGNRYCLKRLTNQRHAARLRTGDANTTRCGSRGYRGNGRDMEDDRGHGLGRPRRLSGQTATSEDHTRTGAPVWVCTEAPNFAPRVSRCTLWIRRGRGRGLRALGAWRSALTHARDTLRPCDLGRELRGMGARARYHAATPARSALPSTHDGHRAWGIRRNLGSEAHFARRPCSISANARHASTVVKMPTTLLFCMTMAHPYLCSAMVPTT